MFLYACLCDYVWTILLLEILLEKFKLNKDKMRHEEDNKDADTAHTCALARAPTHTHTQLIRTKVNT